MRSCIHFHALYSQAVPTNFTWYKIVKILQFLLNNLQIGYFDLYRVIYFYTTL